MSLLYSTIINHFIIYLFNVLSEGYSIRWMWLNLESSNRCFNFTVGPWLLWPSRTNQKAKEEEESDHTRTCWYERTLKHHLPLLNQSDPEALFIEWSPIRANPRGLPLTLNEPVRADIQGVARFLPGPALRPHIPTPAWSKVVSKNHNGASHWYSDFQFYKYLTFPTSKVNVFLGVSVHSEKKPLLISLSLCQK